MGKIIAIDVGNSNVVAAVLENGKCFFTERFKTHDNWKENTVLGELRRILAKHELPESEVEGAIISSVVPEMNPLLMQALRVMTGKPPLLVGPTLKTDFKVRNYDMSCLGMDRVVDMTAAKAAYPFPIMVVDLGTCTTISVIDHEGYFIGGMICAGIQLSLDAEAEHTAQLPALRADGVDTLIGSDTVSNMLSGEIIGTAAMIDGLADRIWEEISGEEARKLNIVLTGGLSNQVLPWLRNDVHFEPELLLKGLELIYRKNSGQYEDNAGGSQKTEEAR
jgi:type III pantothenate kinase